MNKLIGLASLTALAMMLGCASTATPPPATTPDGLELVSSDKHSAVYQARCAAHDLRNLGVVPCKVAFRKNWQRDYNSAHRSTSQQVKQRDIDRIKTTSARSAQRSSPMH